MLCPECDRDNPLGSKFCGFCGSPVSASLAPAAATTVLSTSPPAPHPRVSEEMSGLAVAPASRDRERSAHGSDHGTTRYLCAAVTLDPVLERKAIDDVLEEQQRAVVTTPGVDLVTVLKYALAAQRRRLARDAVLLVLLCALIVTFFLRSYVFLLLLVQPGHARPGAQATW